MRQMQRASDTIAGLEDALDAIASAFERADAYVVGQGYRGYDPYDALTSPLFRLPGLRRNRFARRGAQQVLRRLPVNVRPLLGIRKGLSPVTVALVLQARSSLAGRGRWQAAPDECRRLVELLEGLRSPGWSGACWGYEFDWETREGAVPARTPTVVATGFVTNALFLAHERLGVPGALGLCSSAARFVLEDLHRTVVDDGSFCWSYSPLDRGRVLNATAKGSRLLAQVFSVTGAEELRDAAERSLRYVVAHQREDGSWPYAVDDPRTWVDNFHTAYVLDALREYARRTGDHQFEEARERGWRYYRSRFFVDDRIPRYYDSSTLPIDATACAQSMLTLCDEGDVDTAVRVAEFTIGKLQRRDGSFAYRAYRFHTTRIPYMRWATAWMLCALAAVLAAASDGVPPGQAA